GLGGFAGRGFTIRQPRSSVDAAEGEVDCATAGPPRDAGTGQCRAGSVGAWSAVHPTAGVRGGARQVETIDGCLGPAEAGQGAEYQLLMDSGGSAPGTP